MNFQGKVVRLDVDDIDTDQIIPARFLKTTDKRGLGEKLFADWRGPSFALDQPSARGAEILVAGRNFGCGSSREHAPWALAGAGFRAVVARSFADIFKQNALKNGLLPIALDEAALAAIADGATLAVSLAAQTVTLPDGRAVRFEVDSFARHCLLNGQDELGYLLSFAAQVDAYEARCLNL